MRHVAVQAAVWAVPVLMWFYYLTAFLAPGSTHDSLMIVLGTIPPAIALALLPLRRRASTALVLLTGLLLVLSPGVIGVAFVAQATVARRVGRVEVVLLCGGWLVATKILTLLTGPFAESWNGATSVEATVAVAGLVIATLAGWLARSVAAESRTRADVKRAQHDAEQARIDSARLAEREQIAREMHDVLAHRLSLIGLHAGMLAFRGDLSAEESRSTAQLIQRNAKQSLAELRTVLSTLRGADQPPEPPQPALTELPVLVADLESDQRVDLAVDTDITGLPVQIGRHGYRIVQEALTNARKHAPGAPVSIQVTGKPGATLDLWVSNPLTDLARPDRTGSGFGLLGLTERAASLGGSVTYGAADGRFTVTARLPWEDSSS